MKETARYDHLLGLKTPWSVKRLNWSLADQRVEVALKNRLSGRLVNVIMVSVVKRRMLRRTQEEVSSLQMEATRSQKCHGDVTI